MADEAAAAKHYNAALIDRATQAAVTVSGAWAAVKAADIDGTFTGQVVAAILAGIARGQLYGATTAVAYHLGLLAANRLTPQGPSISPAGFAAGLQTAEGYDLRSVVALAPIITKKRIGQGMPPERALQSGQAFLTSVAESETQDAARGALDVALNTDDQYEGYLRVPDPGACGRCLILAGRFYRHDADFLRHPQCSCSSRPVLKDGTTPEPDSPREIFDGLSRAQQDAAFGADGADAIRAGADPAQVQNARRGMRAAGDPFTLEGTRRRKGQRLSPVGCRKQADGEYDEYLRLLRENKYIAE